MTEVVLDVNQETFLMASYGYCAQELRGKIFRNGIYLINGKMTLGTWRLIVSIDFDNRSRKRNILVRVIGALR